MERGIEMNAVQSPLALDLARETRTAVTPAEFMNDTLRRERGLAEIQAFLERNKRQAAEQAAEQATKQATQNADERMIIATIQNNFRPEAIEIMKKTAGITDARFAELINQAQPN